MPRYGNGLLDDEEAYWDMGGMLEQKFPRLLPIDERFPGCGLNEDARDMQEAKAFLERKIGLEMNLRTCIADPRYTRIASADECTNAVYTCADWGDCDTLNAIVPRIVFDLGRDTSTDKSVEVMSVEQFLLDEKISQLEQLPTCGVVNVDEGSSDDYEFANDKVPLLGASGCFLACAVPSRLSERASARQAPSRG
eukprot:COSAG06_NODE_22051_length_736_cov_0.841444_1_plen_194_part_01